MPDLIRAASFDSNEAKRIFLEKTHPENIGKYLVAKQKSGFNLLEEIFENSIRKRKDGKIEYKKIPLPTQAEDLIDWMKPLTFQTRSKYAQDELIKELLDGKPYVLHSSA